MLIVPSTHALGKSLDEDYMGAVGVMHVAIDLWQYMFEEEEDEDEPNEAPANEDSAPLDKPSIKKSQKGKKEGSRA